MAEADQSAELASPAVAAAAAGLGGKKKKREKEEDAVGANQAQKHGVGSKLKGEGGRSAALEALLTGTEVQAEGKRQKKQKSASRL